MAYIWKEKHTVVIPYGLCPVSYSVFPLAAITELETFTLQTSVTIACNLADHACIKTSLAAKIEGRSSDVDIL